MAEQVKKRRRLGGMKVGLREFRDAALNAGMSPLTVAYEASEKVIVHGRQQVDVARSIGVSKQAVNQAVARVLKVLTKGKVCPVCLRRMPRMSKERRATA